MEFWLALIAVIALIISISNQSEINKLKRENQTLRQLINNLLPKQHESSDVVSNPIPQQQVIKPQQPLPRPVVHKELKAPKNMENIFGKNVIGVIAAVLMFIGVFAFGTLVLTSLSDILKVIGMFLVSGAAIAAGLFWTRKNQTVWTNIVTGCGVGLTYISIFLTHLHYHMIGDVVTFILIFIWALGVMLLSKKFKIPSLAYLALAGCIISSILGQVYVVQQHMFIEITIYHFLTFLLLIIANKENLLLFKISSYCSIALNTALSIIITAYANNNDAYSWIYLCFILGIYNIAIGILTYREKKGNPTADIIIHSCAYVINMVFTGIIPFVSILVEKWMSMDDIITIQSIDYNAFYAQRALMIHIGILIIAAVFYAAYHLFIHDTTKRSWVLITTEIIWGFIVLVSPLEIKGEGFSILLALPIANLLLTKFSKDTSAKQLAYWSGFAFLLADAATSLFFIMDFGWYGVIHSALLLGLACLYMHERYDSVLHFPFLQCALINGHLLFTLLNVCDNWTIAVIIVVLLNMAWSAITELFTKQPQVSKILIECAESLLAFIVFWCVLEAKTTYPVGSFILSILLIPFMLMRIRQVIRSKNAFMSVWYGIKFTFYTFGSIEMFTEFTQQQFIVSVVLMLLASACIGFGFWKELKALRIYGLVLILSSVAKMVIIDVWNQESIIRVLALIAGALICFGISAIYTKIETKQLQLSTPNEPSDNE